MNAYINAIITSMHEQLDELNIVHPLQHAEAAYQIVRAAMQKHQQYMDHYSFADIKEEIDYFKNIRPGILRELIYYGELCVLEAFRPIAGDPSVEQYLKGSLNIYYQFFTRNLGFYNYYRTQKTEQDAVYFVRKPCALSYQPVIPPEIIIENYSDGSSDYSYKLAKIHALERLISYTNREIHALNKQDNIESPDCLDVKWTGKKVDLIELAYAIKATDTVNHGNATIKDIIRALENTFHIKLGNFYSVFLKDIRLRKDSSTYLDKMKKGLIDRIVETDLNPKSSQR